MQFQSFMHPHIELSSDVCLDQWFSTGVTRQFAKWSRGFEYKNDYNKLNLEIKK
jgi:hypothetical protein